MEVILIGILILIVIQQFTIVKSRKKRHQMGHDELTGICNWEHLVQKAEKLYKSDRPRYDTFQGYYFSKPISVGEFEKLYMDK